MAMKKQPTKSFNPKLIAALYNLSVQSGLMKQMYQNWIDAKNQTPFPNVRVDNVIYVSEFREGRVFKDMLTFIARENKVEPSKLRKYFKELAFEVVKHHDNMLQIREERGTDPDPILFA